ncbi:dihydroneopterin aldolase [Alkalihalobacterium bogoriense]|uniref:dihydroneopterin aldolase n=1 Tax=Alkalihalobacterium bogoriense TaxID=246272 RepID=UPI000479B827|nr:dihydroneopterin aldolase [Alkalihalobacterium bogoriense]
MDKIHIERMKFYGYHGVLPEENTLGQRYIVTVQLELDLQKAGQSDDLKETVNYADVYKATQAIVEGKPYQLVETLAEKIADSLLSTFEKVQQCTIKVIKPDPPIAGHYESVAVEITRSRSFG